MVDYAIALEATLVFEADFVSRRLRERGVNLLGLDGDIGVQAKRVLNACYGLRSKIAHGSGHHVEADEAVAHMPAFEWLVRQILCRAVLSLPAEEADRQKRLRGLFELSVDDRLAKLRQDLKAIPASRRSEISAWL